MADTDNQRSINLAGSLVGLGLVGVLSFIAWALVYHEIPDKNSAGFSTLLGIISGNVGLVVGFYFGSSANNRKQAETISTLANTAAAQTKAAPPTNEVQFPPRS